MGVHPACSSAVTASLMGVLVSVVCLTGSKQGCSLGKFQSVSLLRHLDREEENTFSDHSSALFGCQTLLYKVTYSDTLCGLPTCIPGELLGNPHLIPVSELGSRLLWPPLSSWFWSSYTGNSLYSRCVSPPEEMVVVMNIIFAWWKMNPDARSDISLQRRGN